MSLNREYILRRATQTYSAMVVIKNDVADSWEWSEMLVVDFKTKLDGANALVEAASDEAADTLAARGDRDANIAALMAKVRSYLKLAKRKYRNDSAKMVLLKPLEASNKGLAKNLKLALDVEHAWKQIDQAYVPETGNTFAAFAALRTTCQTKYENVSKEGAEEGEAGGEVYKALKELYRLSVDWYQEAIRRFGPETPHGILIRDTIDTSPGAPTPLPGQAVITEFSQAGSGEGLLKFNAPNATLFDVWVQRPADPDFVLETANFTGTELLVTNVPPGTTRAKVVPKNSRGEGPESEVAELTI
jgi:hypothetical protein